MLKIEFRNNQIRITGYVNVVGRASKILTNTKGVKFKEVIVPKTFKRALMSASNIDLLLNHKKKLGSTQEGNLKLHEDAIGLRADAVILDKKVIEKARKGKLTGWSFKFKSYKEDWIPGKDNILRRFIRDLVLLEVSVLDDNEQPAYEGTSIEMRSLSFNDLGVYEKELEILKFKGEFYK